MEELKIKGIVTKSVDYKEKDKLVNIFSVELGNICAVLKNCKGEKAKLKFAFSPFCFAEFELIKRDDFLQIKNATSLENFFEISSNYFYFVCGSAMLEMVEKSFQKNETSPIVFVNLIKCLNLLLENNVSSNLILLKFAIGLLKNLGYRLNFNACANCGMPFVNKIFLNLESGELECGSCGSNYSVVVSKSVFNVLSNISKTEVDDLVNLKFDEKTVTESLKLMILNFENRINNTLKTKSQLFVNN